MSNVISFDFAKKKKKAKRKKTKDELIRDALETHGSHSRSKKKKKDEK
jgi:hypothetical protein